MEFPINIILGKNNSREIQEEVQKKLFEYGCRWMDGEKKIRFYRNVYNIIIREDKKITCCHDDCNHCSDTEQCSISSYKRISVEEFLNEKPLYFKDVKINQYFYDIHGKLHLKFSSCLCKSVSTHKDEEFLGNAENMYINTPIMGICKKVFSFQIIKGKEPEHVKK